MKFILYTILNLMTACAFAQGPAVTSWLQNTTETGSYYMEGNSTAIDNGILYNCQKIEYSDNFVYVHTTGIPAYPTGPFQDGNPSQATDQAAIFQMPLFPTENTGTKNPTTGGNIGIFINGVALFDYRDGVAWNPQTNSLCGGPGFDRCPGGMGSTQDWNRDAIPAERMGFDCSKAHPAMGNYHHHQNPSAFKLDKEVVSDVCNLYDADGLYAIDETQHSPLIGYAYDGFPIYGAYGFKNSDGSGGIARIKSGYQLRDITTRENGPDVDLELEITVMMNTRTETLFLGYFREDYEHIVHPGEEDYLDEHNGRFCITPEYPDGTYAYFATVDENWNSAYPYVVGPTFYGNSERRNVNTVNETTEIYTGGSATKEQLRADLSVSIVPNPASDLIAVQINDLVIQELQISLIDNLGKIVQTKNISAGSTIAYFDVRTVYAGTYIIKVANEKYHKVEQVMISKN